MLTIMYIWVYIIPIEENKINKHGKIFKALISCHCHWSPDFLLLLSGTPGAFTLSFCPQTPTAPGLLLRRLFSQDRADFLTG